MDPAAVSAAILALIVNGANARMQLTTMVDGNLSQGLGVINNQLIQQTGSVFISASNASTNPGLISGLQTAAGSPRQGMDSTTGAPK